MPPASKRPWGFAACPQSRSSVRPPESVERPGQQCGSMCLSLISTSCLGGPARQRRASPRAQGMSAPCFDGQHAAQCQLWCPSGAVVELRRGRCTATCAPLQSWRPLATTAIRRSSRQAHWDIRVLTGKQKRCAKQKKRGISPPFLGRETLGWALQGLSGVGVLQKHRPVTISRDTRVTLGLGTGNQSGVGRSRDTLGLGTLQDTLALGTLGHSRENWGLGTLEFGEE